MRVATRALASGAAAAGMLLGVLGTPAGAAPPDDRGTFGLQVVDVDETFVEEDFCGIDGLTVEVHIVERGREFFTYRGRDAIPHYTSTFHYSLTFMELDADGAPTGTTSSITSHTMVKDQQVVDNGDGTFTITGRAAGGWRFTGPATTLRNPGMQLFEGVIDTMGTPQDPFDDEIVEEFVPISESTGLNEQGEGFCEDYLLVTGRAG